MNVAMIGRTNTPSVTELSTRLVRAGHQVTVYLRRSSGQGKADRYNGIHFRYLSLFLSALHICFILRPDVVHVHGKTSAMLLWTLRLLRPQAAVVATERIREGVTVRRVATDDVVLEPYKLRSGEFALAILRDAKDANILVEAWKLAKNNQPNIFSRNKLAIVSAVALPGSSDDSIVYTGFQSGETLKALFAGAKFLINPSVAEGSLAATLEGMSYGRAVIAADAPESREVVDGYGVPFEANDVADLADKMIELMSDPMSTAAIGHVARTFVEDEYSWDEIALETLHAYREEMVSRGILASYETNRS